MRHLSLCCALIVVSGFGFSGCAPFRPTPLKPRHTVHIAYAHRLPDPEIDGCHTSGCAFAKYYLDQIVAGHFLTTTTVVGFFSNSVPKNGLPDKAILILADHPFETLETGLDGTPIQRNTPPRPLATGYAIGGDAFRGILRDTEENRKIIAALPAETLARNSSASRISKEKAEEAALHFLQRELSGGERPRLAGASRYSYGWWIQIDIIQPDGSQFVGGACTVIVGDDGQIKDKTFGL